MIEFTHIITADDPFGEPWPPPGSCSVVRRSSNGFTLWRCIRLSENRVHVPPPTAHAASFGGNEDTMTNQQKTQTLKMEKEEMKLKTESSALPAVQPATETLAQLDADVAALAAEARDLTDDVRVGDDLRFKKGKWAKTIGDEAIKIGVTFDHPVLKRLRGEC